MNQPVLDRLKAALAGRYDIEREAGQGAMAIVYLAQDVKHDRRVALKLMRPEIQESVGTERFLREIRISAKLSHPHILPLLDSGEEEGLLYYVMPFVEGESLRERLDREHQIPIEDALQITRDVASALGYAHEAGVVHRDIKPANIMLSDGKPVVTDFGIARALDVAGGEKLTATGLSIGTPTYMSPEQAGGEVQVDGRADLYALGCVLYEMLAGEPPYTGSSPRAVMVKMLTDAIPSVRRLRETVSLPLDEVVTKALAKSTADRYSTASHMIEALAPERLGAAPRRRIRWRRWLGGAAAAMAVLLFSGFLVARNRVGVFGLAQPITIVLAAPPEVPGDSTLGLAIQVGLQRALVESARVTSLPVDRVRRTLENMGRSPDARLDSALALEVAERNGAGGVVLASVLQVGGGYQLSAQVLSPTGELIAAARANARGQDSLLVTIDVLASGLRLELGDKARDLERSRDLSGVLTSSLQALRLWAQADAILGSGDFGLYLEAEALLTQATMLDPDFGEAYVGLFAIRQILDADYLAPAEHLVAMRESSSSEEQFGIDLLDYLFVGRDPPAILEITVQMARRLDLPGLALTFFSKYTPDEIAVYRAFIRQLNSNAYGEMGDRERELEWLDLIIRDADAVPYNSTLPVSFANAAMALAALGDRVGAERMLEERSERFPGSTSEVQLMIAISGREWERATLLIRALHSDQGLVGAPYILALLGTVEAVRGRPSESREAFESARDAARQLDQPYLETIVQFRRAEAEFYAMDEPGRAAEIVASLLSAPRSDVGMERRMAVQAQNLAAAMCVTGALDESTAARLCTLDLPVDSVRDEIEALELMQWKAIEDGRLDDAVAIGSGPDLGKGGAPRLHARIPSAIAFERLGQPDSAAAVYRELLEKTPATLINHIPASLVRRSFVLRRLMALGGAHADFALDGLRHDWADAESEFMERVGNAVLGAN